MVTTTNQPTDRVNIVIEQSASGRLENNMPRKRKKKNTPISIGRRQTHSGTKPIASDGSHKPISPPSQLSPLAGLRTLLREVVKKKYLGGCIYFFFDRPCITAD